MQGSTAPVRSVPGHSPCSLFVSRALSLSASHARAPTHRYPITTGCSLLDATSGSDASFHVATDRAQGVASLADGQLDVLLHRCAQRVYVLD